jgi:hypothetical protein
VSIDVDPNAPAPVAVSFTGIAPTVLFSILPLPIVIIDVQAQFRLVVLRSFTRQQSPSSLQTTARSRSRASNFTSGPAAEMRRVEYVTP